MSLWLKRIGIYLLHLTLTISLVNIDYSGQLFLTPHNITYLELMDKFLVYLFLCLLFAIKQGCQEF